MIKMRMSYSRVETFNQCPYKFYLSYIQGLKTYPNYDPSDARIIGTALHTGIEQDIDTAISDYYANFPIIDDKHIEEAIKLECVVQKAREILPVGEHEVKVEVMEPIHFLGFMDLLVPVEKDVFDLYDFKYSNNIDRYLESGQLHVYKHYFELANPGKKIRNLYFVFAPKVQIRLKKNETLEMFRIRLRGELNGKNIEIREVTYNEEKVKEFLKSVERIENATEYPKNVSRLCDWCDYQKYCESDGSDTSDIDPIQTALNKEEIGVDNMQLPKNERTPATGATKKKIWIYGAPFSGKTYLANEFPDVLFLSTDGNYTQLPNGIPPHIDIKDEVTVEGRITKRKHAWEVFKEVIEELEKKDNPYKTIVVDILEDTNESCRRYMYQKLGIEHESDGSYGKGWDMIKSEFLDTMRRVMMLDYNIVLISHEDMSKDLTKKSGDKITSIKPNIGDKLANKIAGMVDMVARVINDDGERTISFKTNEFIFGGGRLELDGIKDIPCDYTALCEVYDKANKGKKAPIAPVETPKQETKPTEPIKDDKPVEVKETASMETATVEPVGETPKKPAVEVPRRRRRKTTSEE